MENSRKRFLRGFVFIMIKYDDIIKLIEEESDCIDFAPYGDGISEEWIEKAEKYLNMKLPNSYKWWLRNYSGGEIAGEEIFSIYEIDFSMAVGGDIVYMSIINEKNGLCGKEKLYISNPGKGESFYFITNKGESGEYPIYVYDQENDIEEEYASDFVGFLKKRIEFNC